MFIPVDSNVQLKTFPVVTLGLIALNTVAFFATVGFEPVEVDDRWVLSFETINPIQWVTHGFMHADFFHLAGNMFFLWTFGMIVEGLIGSVKFLAIYMFIDVVDGAILQIPMLILSGENGAMGASGILFGLMGIAYLWAPKSHVECINLIPPLYFKMPMLGFVILYLVRQVWGIAWMTLWSGIQLSSEMLHVIGLAIGVPLGVGLLYSKWYDSHGQDALSLYWLEEPLGTPIVANQEPQDYVAAAMGIKTYDDSNGTSVTEEVRMIGRALWAAIHSDNTQGVSRIYGKLRVEGKVKQVPTKTISEVAKFLGRHRKWEHAVAALQDLTKRERETKNIALLQIATIQFNRLEDMKAARLSLKQIKRPDEAIRASRKELIEKMDEAEASIP